MAAQREIIFCTFSLIPVVRSEDCFYSWKEGKELFRSNRERESGERGRGEGGEAVEREERRGKGIVDWMILIKEEERTRIKKERKEGRMNTTEASASASLSLSSISKPTIIYFNFPGRAELSRLLLELAGVEYHYHP